MRFITVGCVLGIALFITPERQCEALSCVMPKVYSFSATLLDLERIDNGAAVHPETLEVPFTLCLSRTAPGEDQFFVNSCGYLATVGSLWKRQ